MKTLLSTLTLGLIALMLAPPAWAQPPDVRMIEAEVATLQGQVATLLPPHRPALEISSEETQCQRLVGEEES